jgi:hypothetical protein
MHIRGWTTENWSVFYAFWWEFVSRVTFCLTCLQVLLERVLVEKVGGKQGHASYNMYLSSCFCNFPVSFFYNCYFYSMDFFHPFFSTPENCFVKSTMPSLFNLAHTFTLSIIFNLFVMFSSVDVSLPEIHGFLGFKAYIIFSSLLSQLCIIF